MDVINGYEDDLKYAQDKVEKIKQRIEALRKFPEDDFESGTVIAFDRRFDPNGKVYNYAGVKLDNGYWVITGKFSSSLTWAKLIEMLVDEGECIAFAVASDMESLI